MTTKKIIAGRKMYSIKDVLDLLVSYPDEAYMEIDDNIPQKFVSKSKYKKIATKGYGAFGTIGNSFPKGWFEIWCEDSDLPVIYIDASGYDSPRYMGIDPQDIEEWKVLCKF